LGSLIAFARRQVYGLMLGLTIIHFIFLGPPAGNGGPRADQAGNRLRQYAQYIFDHAAVLIPLRGEPPFRNGLR
jgi:hypothetical protein